MLDSSSRLFIGIVSSSDAATYTIQVDGLGAENKGLLQGIPLVGVFASTLGFKSCDPIPVGISVLCYKISSDICLVLGMIPDHDIANTRFFSRACLNTADPSGDEQNTVGYNQDSTKKITTNHNRPTDVVEGEHIIANELGVLVGLMQELAILKGSELAQVQCFLLDDLVRVISHNYEHFSALGEYKIWHDGKVIQAEFGATHLSQETLGVAQVVPNNKPVFAKDGENPSIDDKSDYYKITEDERIKAIERFKVFLGRLSDFVHMFMVCPDKNAVRTLNGEITGNFDTGLMDWYIGLDGRVSLRSATAISIEKTNWIMVPHRVRNPEDPEGDDCENVEFDKKDPFKFDNNYKYRNNPTLYALQLRDCNAYLQDFSNYKNWFKQEKDFKLSKSPTKQETALREISQVDKDTITNYVDYVLRKSGVFLMDNGGVTIMDAWGSAIVMEGGDIRHQPARDYVVQPMRNYLVKAGQFASICAKKDLDFSSTDGGFRVKTKKVQHLYSHEQGIILQSEAQTSSEPTPTDEAYSEFGGIMLKSKSSVYTYADKIFDRAALQALYKGEGLTLESVDKALNIKSKNSINVVGEKDVNLLSKANMNVIAISSLQAAGAHTNIGRKDTIVGLIPHKGSIGGPMDGVLDLAVYQSIIDQLSGIDYQQQMSPFTTDDKFKDIKFHFLTSDKYKLQSGSEEHIPMTIAQQDDESFGFLSLTAWQEQEVNGTLPFPGKDKFDKYYIKSETKNLQSLHGQDIYSKDSDSLVNEPGPLKAVSLQQYKILEK